MIYIGAAVHHRRDEQTNKQNNGKRLPTTFTFYLVRNLSFCFVINHTNPPIQPKPTRQPSTTFSINQHQRHRRHLRLPSAHQLQPRPRHRGGRQGAGAGGQLREVLRLAGPPQHGRPAKLSGVVVFLAGVLVLVLVSCCFCCCPVMIIVIAAVFASKRRVSTSTPLPGGVHGRGWGRGGVGQPKLCKFWCRHPTLCNGYLRISCGKTSLLVKAGAV